MDRNDLRLLITPPKQETNDFKELYEWMDRSVRVAHALFPEFLMCVLNQHTPASYLVQCSYTVGVYAKDSDTTLVKHRNVTIQAFKKPEDDTRIPHPDSLMNGFGIGRSINLDWFGSTLLWSFVSDDFTCFRGILMDDKLGQEPMIKLCLWLYEEQKHIDWEGLGFRRYDRELPYLPR